MNRRVLKVVGVLAALILVFAIGAAAGGGVVFAAAQVFDGNRGQVVIGFQADQEAGIVIASVAPDSPAEAAGIKRGDILLKIDDQAINSTADLFNYLAERTEGDEVVLVVLHGDEERTLTATLGARNGRAYLGVVPCGPGMPDVISLRVAQPGALITDVVPDGPADQAGLEAGDIVVAIDGQEITDETGLADLIAEHQPGDTVTLEVARPGEDPRDVTVKLGEHPDEEGKAYLGIQYAPTPRIEHFEGEMVPFVPARPFLEEPFYFSPDIDVEEGAIVMRVADESPAQAAGLERGDIITAIDGEPVDGPGTLVDMVGERNPGDTISLTVYRPKDGETVEIEATLAEHPEEETRAYLGVVTVPFPRMFYREGEKMPGMKDTERRFMFRVPFQLEIKPHWFERPAPPADCCGDNFMQTI